jgi:hypothetical protein
VGKGTGYFEKDSVGGRRCILAEVVLIRTSPYPPSPTTRLALQGGIPCASCVDRNIPLTPSPTTQGLRYKGEFPAREIKKVIGIYA